VVVCGRRRPVPRGRGQGGAMDPSLATGIRAELRAFVTGAGNRRALPTSCHVGHPGGEHSRFAHAAVDEASLRADLVERALDGLEVVDGACAWVTRGGELHLTDADAEWFAASMTAFARYGLVLPAFFVLNRTGWIDLVSEERRQWTRVRPHSPSTP
jgi:hypothetical protein